MDDILPSEEAKIPEKDESDDEKNNEDNDGFKQDLLKHFNTYIYNETFKLNKFKDDNSNEFVANLAVYLKIRLLLPEVNFENIKNDIPLNVCFRFND